jgi:L-fuculose-phosphate aldolase
MISDPAALFPPDDHTATRHALVAASLELVRNGLNQGTAGNISVRAGRDLLITPSGVPPAQTHPAMIATMPLDGDGAFTGPNTPSSEWRLHRDILVARADAGAVVHTHSLYATVLATQHRAIPALHYMIAAFGGSTIRCTPYVPFGTQDLSDLIIEYLGPRHGVLLGNHGMVVTGATLDQAMWRAGELETLAKMYVLATMGATPDTVPKILSDDEIVRTIARFESYGMTAKTAAKP